MAAERWTVDFLHDQAGNCRRTFGDRRDFEAFCEELRADEHSHHVRIDHQSWPTCRYIVRSHNLVLGHATREFNSSEEAEGYAADLRVDRFTVDVTVRAEPVRRWERSLLLNDRGVPV